VNRPCPRCYGRGHIVRDPCPACAGSGQVHRTKKLRIRIPEAVEDGARVRLRGQGQPGLAGGPPGDLYVTFRTGKHRFFIRKGKDVYCEVPIDIVQASLGMKIRVKTIEGKKVELKIPPGTQNGTTFRLKGLGVKTPTGRGDQYVTVKVVVPEKLTEKQRKLMEELAKEGARGSDFES